VSRVLILGGNGMLGHVLWRTCRERFDTYATVRSEEPGDAADEMLDPDLTVAGVVAEEPRSVARALDETRPDAVVNCIGVVKQTINDPSTAIRVNALFPHELASACRERGARLVHVSTDCVFSGRKGGYTESDRPDPDDVYGRSKLLGEVAASGTLTIRTSMIGRELATSNGLLEWFLSQSGASVRGFTRAVFSGPTAPVLSRAIATVLERHQELEGPWHLGAAPIAKHDLLLLLRQAFELDVEIEPDESLVVDRSLDSTSFRNATGWSTPSWHDMVVELAGTAEQYAAVRQGLARR